ncbi:unnamed protein product [Eretmochelys imbricata]
MPILKPACSCKVPQHLTWLVFSLSFRTLDPVSDELEQNYLQSSSGCQIETDQTKLDFHTTRDKFLLAAAFIAFPEKPQTKGGKDGWSFFCLIVAPLQTHTESTSKAIHKLNHGECPA